MKPSLFLPTKYLLPVLFSILSIFFTAASQAETPFLSCIGTAETSYSPGLLMTPQEVQLSWIDRYSTCLPNSHNITSGITVGSAISEASCLTLIGEETAGSQRIDWDNGQYSIMSWSSDDVIITTTLSTQTYTVNATVTEGLFLGSRVIEEIILTTPNLLQCLIEPGVTETGGPLVLMIQSAL